MAKQTFTTGSVLTATQMNNLQANDYNWTVSQKTASYVLVAADAGTRVEMNAAGATTITVNTGLFTAGDTLFIQNIGAGVCTITAGTATVQKSSAGSFALSQYQGGYLYFISASNAVFFADAGYTPPLTTKGDLFGYSTTNARIPIGTDGQVLTADSAQSLGLKWATSSGGTWTNWTAVVKQSNTPTAVSYGSAYYTNSDYVFGLFEIEIQSGASGTANNPIKIDLPVTAAANPTYQNDLVPIGVVNLFDQSGNVYYKGFLALSSTTQMVLTSGLGKTLTTSQWGNTSSDAAITLGQFDIILGSFAYRKA